MEDYLPWVVSNLAISALLAATAFLVSRIWRNPHVAHGLWLLVLIKLLTPPIYVMEISWFQKSDLPGEVTAKPPPADLAIVPEPFPELTGPARHRKTRQAFLKTFRPR